MPGKFVDKSLRMSGFWFLVQSKEVNSNPPFFSRECRKCSMHAWLKTENFNRNLKSLASIRNYFVLLLEDGNC